MEWLISAWPVLLAVLALIVAACLIGRIMLATDDLQHTIAAILASSGGGYPRVWVTYLAHMPVTWGRPRVIRIRVPVREIPRIRDEAQANEIGRQIRDTYGMRSAETRLHNGVRYWTLTR